MSVFSGPWEILDDPGLGRLQTDLGAPYHGFSVRPDIWVPGSHASIRSVRAYFLGLTTDQEGARSALSACRDQGLADPGVAESMVLSGQLHFLSWSGR